MFEDRRIIPKCFNGLDREIIHLYDVNKKKFDERYCPNHYKMFIKMFIICQNLNTLLLYNNAYLMMHNSNMKTQTHQKRNFKLAKTCSIPSFEKVKIKFSNISDPVVKNLST